MKKILISGGNGLIGYSLIEALKINEECEIYCIARHSNIQFKNAILIDLSTDWNIDLLPSKIDVVIHLAQSENFRNFPGSSEEVFNVNTVSTLKLLNYARSAGASRFIYASSGGVYGNSDGEFSEDSPVSLRSDLGFYLSTKFCSELLVQSYSSFFNIDILRFFFVFGPRQRKDMLIPRLINSVENGLPIRLQGNDGIKINPIYVTDAVEAIQRCLTLNGNNRINVAGMEVLSLRDISELIGQNIGREPVFVVDDTEPKHLVADISRMRSILFTPKVGFKEALINMKNAQ